MARLQDFENPFVWAPDGDAPRHLAALREPRAGRWWEGRGAFVGEFRMEVCRHCGLAELSVLDAARVPWGDTATASGIEVAERPCVRCGGARVVRLSQVFPGHDALKLGHIDTTWIVREASPVGHVAGAVCPDCGMFTLRLEAPQEVPWERLVSFSRTTLACPDCGTRMGRLEHVGDPTATVANATTDHFYVEGVGHTMAWVCPDCGRIDLAIRDHDSVPWERIRGFCAIPGPCTAVTVPQRGSPAWWLLLGCLGVVAALFLGLVLAMWWSGLIRSR